MKAKNFELTVAVSGIEHYLSTDADKPSGWWITVFVGNVTNLRLFFPESLFRDENGKEQHPALMIGELIQLEIPIPLVYP